MLLSGNTQEMQSLATTFHGAAADVQSLLARLTGPVHGTTWTGPAAERFRTQWDAEFSPMLVKLEEALTTNATIVTQRMTALEQASA